MSDADGFRVGFYLSADSAIDPKKDTLLDSQTIKSLAGYTLTSELTQKLTLPNVNDDFWKQGKIKDFYLGMVVDDLNAIEESNEKNNPIIENSLIQINWEVNENYHFGGYGKTNNGLKDFIKWFQQTNNIPLDFLYTGKMMFGIYDMIEKEIFKRGDTIVAIHTGGMQGNLGKDFSAIKKQNLKFQ